MSGETILIEQLRADVERLRERAEKAERCADALRKTLDDAYQMSLERMSHVEAQRDGALTAYKIAEWGLGECNDRAEKAERKLAVSTTEIDSLRGKLAMLSAQARNAERERDDAISRTYVPLDKMKKRIDAYWDGRRDALRYVAIGLAFDLAYYRHDTRSFSFWMAHAYECVIKDVLDVLATLGDEDAKRMELGE